MKNILLTAIVVMGIFCIPSQPVFAKKESAKRMSNQEVTEYWHSGKTLPLEVGVKYPPTTMNIKNDKGFNILIDVSHNCVFNSLWFSTGRLGDMGYRAIPSQASLHSVLKKDGVSRIRIPYSPEEKVWPFAWYPNFKYNVIFTEQGNPNNPDYMPQEIDALDKFVKRGGGLLIMANPTDGAEKSSQNKLIERFGASMKGETAVYQNIKCAVLEPGDDWKIVAQSGDQPIIISRSYGKGNIFVVGNSSLIYYGNRPDEVLKSTSDERLQAMLEVMCKDQKPDKKAPNYPTAMGGGGSIFPEKEAQNGDIVVYYAENQKSEIVDVAKTKLNEVAALVMGWLPSPKTNEPMYLILSGGSGGGWAVNARMPKENGIISMRESGIISIFAHELAHTLKGPLGRYGGNAGSNPFGNSGEPHAGWFQGKIDAYYNESLRDFPCKKIVIFEDSEFFNMDLKDVAKMKKYGKGKDWAKIWYIWQKLDDRYGTTWYPRWLYIQHTRWSNTPGKSLTWEESVEDMSIAVGEDLFPFFRAIGISLDRENIGEVKFDGDKINLPVSPIEPTAPGKIRLEPIGDYTQKIIIK